MEEREQNYWPGFVDALSNVVLTLLFVLVVFVFALATSMSRAAQQIEKTAETAALQKVEAAARSSQSANAQLEEANAKLETRLAQADAAVAALRAEVADKDSELKAAEIEVAEQRQKIENKAAGVVVAGDRIVISYPLSAADLDPKAAEALAKALDAFAAKRRATIRSIEGGEPFSAAQRYAYYRAVAIRNALLSKGFAAAGIKSVVMPAQGSGGGRVEIRF